MPPSKDAPLNLQPFLFWGIDLKWKDSDKNAVGDCPWCGKPKFSVEIATSKWKCWVCAEGSEKGGGNATTFIRLLWEKSFEETKTAAYSDLVRERGYVYPDSLIRWGVCRSITTAHWIIPGYNGSNKLTQLYRYSKVGDKMRLLPTPGDKAQGFGHALHGIYNPAKPIVYITEGPWDGIALEEAMSLNKETDYNACVLAVPGVAVFLDSWIPLFEGKTVNILFDNDHPQKHPRTQKRINPVGYSHMKRVAGLLKDVAKQVNLLKWGDRDHEPSLKSGWDVRDALINME